MVSQFIQDFCAILITLTVVRIAHYLKQIRDIKVREDERGKVL